MLLPFSRLLCSCSRRSSSSYQPGLLMSSLCRRCSNLELLQDGHGQAHQLLQPVDRLFSDEAMLSALRWRTIKMQPGPTKSNGYISTLLRGGRAAEGLATAAPSARPGLCTVPQAGSQSQDDLEVITSSWCSDREPA